MAEKPASPFVGLDKALLRPTRAQSAPTDEAEAPATAATQEAPAPSDARAEETRVRAPAQPTRQPRRIAANPPRHHDAVVSRYQDDMVDTIRRAVRVVGKEAATYRYSPEEKARVADIIYTYKRHGLRTSENEISRIAPHHP